MNGQTRLLHCPPGSHDTLQALPPALALFREPTEVERARAVLRQRQMRSMAFSPVRSLFHDPAWDILLTVFIAHEDGRSLTADAIADLLGLPVVSVGRWILAMDNGGLITPRADAMDLSDRPVSLTDTAVEMMLTFLRDT